MVLSVARTVPCVAATCRSSCSALASNTSSCRQQPVSSRTRQRTCINATERSSDGNGTDFLEDLTRDEPGLGENLEAFQKSRADRLGWGEGLKWQPDSLQQSEKEQTFGDKVKDAVEKVLIADFFFVCIALLLLVFGVGEKLAFSTTYVLDVWLQGWTLVVQPAIGVLMAGALFSGGFAWFQKDILKEK